MKKTSELSGENFLVWVDGSVVFGGMAGVGIRAARYAISLKKVVSPIFRAQSRNF
jgi:tRNA G26 N,N-dimethylase Trm1